MISLGSIAQKRRQNLREMRKKLTALLASDKVEEAIIMANKEGVLSEIPPKILREHVETFVRSRNRELAADIYDCLGNKRKAESLRSEIRGEEELAESQETLRKMCN